MSAKPRGERPLSPFMIGPYYRPQLTSMLSITHRLTGVGNAIGAIGLIVWLMSIAAGPDALAAFNAHAGAWYGLVLLFAWTWSVAYHLCNGLRHLWWDTGRGFELDTVYRTGYAVIAGSLVLTAIVWIVVLI
jgi:succinate dehydrogenase / fumarate reductase cytochrome b subunit